MSLGKFIDGGKGYQIDTPITPTSWSNCLYNDEYFAEISQTLQGKSYTVKNYSQQAFTSGYRYFYILDHGTGDVWNPNYYPLRRDYDKYFCTHYLNKTELLSERNGVKADIRVFVPPMGVKEIWTVSLTNLTAEEKNFSIFSAFGFSDHGVMGGECNYDEEKGILYKYSFPYHVFYEEKEKVANNLSHYFMISDVDPLSWDMSKRRFFGCDEMCGLPEAVKKGECSRIKAEAEEYCGVFQHKYTLKPGDAATFNLMVGVTGRMDEIEKLKIAFTQETIMNVMEASKRHWECLCEMFTVKTPDTNLDYFMNFWLKKQSVLLTRLNRGTTYCPVRNPLQDTMGYSLIDPKGAKAFMLKLLMRQQKDGFIQQWYMTDDSPAKGLCLLKHTDGPLWLVLCLVVFIRQNGELSILDEEIDYIDGESDTVYNHLLNALKYMDKNLGRHILCLIGDGDWTDPMNGVGRLGRGESTWSTLALIYCIQNMLEFIRIKGDKQEEAHFCMMKDALETAVNTHCWDGEWYVAGFDDEGIAVGGREDFHRVFLNAQTWAVMTGTAKGERLEKVLNTIEKLNTPFGPLLLDPPFTEWDPRWGRISVKKAGTTENGSVYCHASMFKALADCAAGKGAAAYETIRKTLPTNPENPPEKNLQIPTFIPNYYFSLKDSQNFGRSSGHHSTGTVAWMIWVTLEHILGIKATEDGLMVSPCIPEDWKEFIVERKYRDAKYSINVKNPDGVAIGIKHIFVDGCRVNGNILPYADGKSFQVEVIMG